MGHRPEAGRWETENRRRQRTPSFPRPMPSSSRTLPTPPSLHTRKHSITPPARAAHTTLPLFHTEAIINTCNNIFTAANGLLQFRTLCSCRGRFHTRMLPHTQTCTRHAMHTLKFRSLSGSFFFFLMRWEHK